MKCNYVAEILTSCEVVGVKGQVLTFLSQINKSSINTPWSESCLCWHPLLEPPTLLQLCTGARRYAMTSSVGVDTGAAMHIADNAPPELEVKLTGQLPATGGQYTSAVRLVLGDSWARGAQADQTAAAPKSPTSKKELDGFIYFKSHTLKLSKTLSSLLNWLEARSPL